MTQKKKTVTPSIEINLDSLIQTLKTNKEQRDSKSIEVETLQAEQEDLDKGLHTQAVQLQVIHSFATVEQKKQIDDLNIEQFIITRSAPSRKRGRGNATCNIALEILEEAEGEITNEALHHAYLNTLDEDEDGMDYTTFNIAIRPLTNDNKYVTRTMVEERNTRTALMSLTTESS